MDETDRKDLEGHVRRLYRDAAEQLDPDDRIRLATARARAVEVAAPAQRIRWILPATAVAAAAAVGLAVVMNARSPADFGKMASDDPAQEDVEILLATDSLDMLSELDFYLWLDTEPDAG